MRIELLKDIEKGNGKIIPAGTQLEVANFYALELIGSGKAEPAGNGDEIIYPTRTKDSVDPLKKEEEE